MNVTKKDITDTTKLSPELLFAVAATDAVPVQEKIGQLEVANSTQLPIKGLLGKRARWEAIGVKILDDVKTDDPLFCHVELPLGWRKVPRDHDYWTDLVDAEGTVRAEIFYKAAFYDRRADVYLKDDPVASAGSPPSSREPLIVEVPTVLTRIDAQLRAQSTTEPVAGEPPGCVCADCGHEQSTMDPCEKCRSVRVVLLTVIINLFGKNWRDAFKDDEAP